MLRGEPGGSLKGSEVPMRKRTGGSSESRDPDDDGDEGFEDFSVLMGWQTCLRCTCSDCKSGQ